MYEETQNMTRITRITGAKYKIYLNGVELQESLVADPIQSKLVTFLYKIGIKSANNIMCTIDMGIASSLVII